MCYIPKRFTNLLQPADVAWFKPFKAKYTEKWNNWFLTSDNKTYTKNGNMRSPGYAKSIKWLSEIWAEMDSQVIIHSFLNCGILEQNKENYHRVIKKIIDEGRVQNFIDDASPNDAFFNEYSEDDDDEGISNRRNINDDDDDDDDREENDKENDDIDENSDDGIDGEEDCFDDEDDNAETDEDHETRMIKNILEDEFEEEGDIAEDEIETDNDVQKDLNENSMKRRLRKRN